MNPEQQQTPAPPPYNPNAAGASNPYDFLNDTPPPKKRFLPGGSKKTRILIAAVGAAILIMVIAIIWGLAFGGAPSNKDQLLSIARQQNELIRVAAVGVEKSRSAPAKDLAYTTKLTLTTDQQPLLSALKKQKVRISQKELTSGKSAKTDELLSNAEQSNQFDDVFIKFIQTQLSAYQKDLKAAYDNPATGEKLKSTLSGQYKNASLIVNQKAEL